VVPEASRALVDEVLSRMARSGEIERVSRGIYSRPKISPLLVRPLAPDPHDVVAAIERSTGSPLIPSGAFALNALHLSTQVPARPEYFTAGPNRTIFVRKLRIRRFG
jgi:predicted transcriptional regulator of viral defense system